MNRRPIVAGNWKMNGTIASARDLARTIVQAVGSLEEAEVVLCPPFPLLAVAGEIIRDSRISLGAQNVHWEAQGAYTGEVSMAMLKELGCRFCIIGHSERRQLFKETDEDVRKKLVALVKYGFQAILCVGETWEMRRAGRTWDVVKNQLEATVGTIEPHPVECQVTIAYEPIWAIGTGQNATPAQAQEVHALIRSWFSGRMGKEVAELVRIQYGGSVKAENASELMSQADVDGALVGGASLDAKAFVSIVESAIQTKRSKCCMG